MKGIGSLRKLQSILPRTSLLTICKSFIRPHLDYGDVVYDQPSNDAFSNKLETFQHNAALTITEGIKGTSFKKLYQQLGSEYLQQKNGRENGFAYFTKLFQPNYQHISMISFIK